MKSFTHVYMANLIIEDLRKNELCIPKIEGEYQEGSLTEHNAPPLVIPWKGGTYVPPADVRTAILQNPDYFRAGAIGPDMFPDMLFGQGIIHAVHSGRWLELMFNEFGKIGKENPERPKVYAFLLGQMMHYSGDLFGHGYVNEYAGGWFPAITSLAQPKNLAIVVKHLQVEGFMDTYVPQNTPTSLQAPVGFLYDCFANLQNLNMIIGTFTSQNRKDTLSTLEMMPLYWMIKLRDYTYKKTQDSTANMTDILNYRKGWFEDVERAIRDWIAMWCVIAEENTKAISMTQIKARIRQWKDKHLALILGVPHWLKDAADAVALLKDTILYPLTYVLDKLEDMIVETLIRMLDEATGIPSALAALGEAVQMPDEATQKLLGNDFKNYGRTPDTMQQQFRAFSECLTMCKLCLMGWENLNTYFGAGAVFGQRRYDRYLKNVNVTIKTSTALWSGTDDNVYFEIFTLSKRVFSFLLDKAWHNDFENGKTDTYSCSLPSPVAYSDLWAYGFRKDYILVGDDWKVKNVKITDVGTGFVLADDLLEQWIKGRKLFTKAFPDGLGGVKSDVSVDSRIITFLYSLDGQDTSGDNPAPTSLWQNNKFALYRDMALPGTLTEASINEVIFDYNPSIHGAKIPGVAYGGLPATTPESFRDYCLNKTRQYSGDGTYHHEMHIYYCNRLPDAKNRIYLGQHLSAADAVKSANDAGYKNVDGCYYCCRHLHSM